MFKLFKRKPNTNIKVHPGAEKAAGLLAKGLITVQAAWVKWMSTKEKQMTLKQKRKALWIFCLGLGLVGSSLIYKALFIRAITSDFLKPPVVTLPTDTRLPDSLNLEYLRELHKQKKLQADSLHY